MLWYIVAIGSFISAVALAFTAMLLSDDNSIDSSVLMMCAQFLMLTATIFGLDYKLGTFLRNQEQKQ